MSVTAVVRDISHHNKIPDYDAFKANNDAFQIKITESTGFVDEYALKPNGAPGPHYVGCAGKPRAPYHFARPVSYRDQISHFLSVKARIGSWERPDMLDCEFDGITGKFIRELVAEYRHQSGIRKVQVYLGKSNVTTTCPPDQWWDPDIYMQVARYRKIGPPTNTADWKNHLGFDHPGLSTYQWDNATPFYPGGPVGDISYDRVPVTFEGGDVALTTDEINQIARAVWYRALEHPHDPNLQTTAAKDVVWDYVVEGENAIKKQITDLTKLVNDLTGLVKALGGGPVELVPEGSITFALKDAGA
jgi:hypothetical protein